MLLDTISKMPAFPRSFDSVEAKAPFKEAVCGSFVVGLKSAAARRILAAPRFVPVRTQSCAFAQRAPPKMKVTAIKRKRREVKITCFLLIFILPSRRHICENWSFRELQISVPALHNSTTLKACFRYIHPVMDRMYQLFALLLNTRYPGWANRSIEQRESGSENRHAKAQTRDTPSLLPGYLVTLPAPA